MNGSNDRRAEALIAQGHTELDLNSLPEKEREELEENIDLIYLMAFSQGNLFEKDKDIICMLKMRDWIDEQMQFTAKGKAKLVS